MTILNNASTYISGLSGHDDISSTRLLGVHPSVLDFSKIKDGSGNIIGQWPKTGTRRYRYYCGFTSNVVENSYLKASNDNVAWVDPTTGLSTAFIYGEGTWDPYSPPKINFEDAELNYDPTNDCIQCYSLNSFINFDGMSSPYYRGQLWMVQLRNDFTLSSPLTWSNLSNIGPSSVIDLCVSPSIVRESASVLHLWGVSTSGATVVLQYCRSNNNALTWSDPVTCTINGNPFISGWQAAYPGWSVVHVAAQLNPYLAGQVDLISNVIPYTSGVVNNQILDYGQLVHYTTNLSNPTDFKTPLAPSVVLARNASGWDAVGIYRSNFTLDETANDAGGFDVIMNLWYSGVMSDSGTQVYNSSGVLLNKDSRCQIGYTTGKIYSLDANGVMIQPADTIAPTITAFSMPSTANSLTVAITTLTVTDNTAVTGYLITESATPPAAGSAGWSGTAPTTFTFSSAGVKTAYAWAKDAAGNVSARSSAITTITLPDATAPSVTTFTLGAVSGLTVAVAAFTGSDNVGVSGYLVTESATPPAASLSSWLSYAPPSYMAITYGTKLLYPWVKDAAGNVSAVFSTPRQVIFATTNQPPAFVSQPTVQVTTSVGGVIGYGTSDADGDPYKLELSTDGGITWTVVSSNEAPGTGKTLSVTGLSEGTYTVRLRITALTGATTPVTSNSVQLVVAPLPSANSGLARVLENGGWNDYTMKINVGGQWLTIGSVKMKDEDGVWH